MKRMLLAISLSIASISGSAYANIISTEVTILGTDPGAVQYVDFDITTGGNFQIDAGGLDTLGAGYNLDPEIHLFKGSLSLANLIASDDDSGVGWNSLINIFLAADHYILAVSEYLLTDTEAVAGLNAGSINDPDTNIRVTIGSTDGTANLSGQLPEPATLALLGLGLAGLGLTRRRKA